MRRDIVKVRGRALIADLEARVMDGDTRALRALVRQVAGPNTLDAPVTALELKAKPDGTGGTRLQFTGCFSTTEQPYEMQDWLGPYTEVVHSGFLAKTLGVPMGSWSTGPDVIFCLNHGWDAAPMARTKASTLQLMEDSQGGQCEAQLDGARADVYAVQSCMEAGELDAMSFAFWTTRQSWSPDYEQRDILEVDMDGGDTSVVTWPGNPGTNGTVGLRKRQAAALMRTNVPGIIVQRARIEQREGKTLSAATTETLQAILGLLSEAGDSHGSASNLLIDLLGEDAQLDDGGDGEDGNDLGDTPPEGAALDSRPTGTEAAASRSGGSALALLRAKELERSHR